MVNHAFSLIIGLFSVNFLFKIILEPEKSPRKLSLALVGLYFQRLFNKRTFFPRTFFSVKF